MSILGLFVAFSVFGCVFGAGELICRQWYLARPESEYLYTLSVSCSKGSWPSSLEELSAKIPSNTTHLDLRDISFDRTDSPPVPVLPSMPNLTSLRLDHLYQSGSDQVLDDFPVWDFINDVNRTRLKALIVSNMDLQGLGGSDLVGFTRLTELRFSNCSLRQIHPSSFETLVADNAPYRLMELGVESDQVLSFFPWESLRPISEILWVILESYQETSRGTTEFKVQAPILTVNSSF